MNDESGYRVEFSKLESFCYFWKNVWTSDAIRKLKVQILDTVLLSNGKPHSWLFTSQQSGEVMKKRPEKLDSTVSIVDFMRKKSNQFKGYKSAELKPKIAVVWFVRADKALSSYLATEKELGSILSSGLREVVAVQAYIGGFAMKGNGIFQHRVTRASNGSIIHQSHELLDSLGDPPLSCFSNKCKKVIVLEQPMAERLRAVGTALVRHLEYTSSGEVEHLAFQVAFNSTWDPFLVAVRDVTLMKMPLQFYRTFESQVFLDGISPTFPRPNEQSSLLPAMLPNALASVSHDSFPGTAADDRTNAGMPPSLMRGLDIIAEEVAEASRVTLSNHDTMLIPPPDFAHKANYFKSANEDYSLRRERPDLVFVAADDKTLIHRTDSRHAHTHALRPTVRQSAAPPTPHSLNNTQTMGVTSAMIEELMQHRNGLSASLSQSRPKSAVLTASRNSASFWPDKGLGKSQGTGKRYQAPTAGTCHRTTYQGEDLQALPKPLHSFFKVRRPISAPHRADKKQRVNTLRRSIDYVSGSFAFADREGEEDHSDVIRRAVSYNSYETVDTADTLGGAAFWRTLPHSSGKECFGDYCWFQEQCKVVYAEVRGERERHVVVTNTAGEVYYTEHDVSRKAARTAVSELPPSAQVGFKSAACPYRLSLKSVLLARSENKVVGEALNTSVASLVIRNKLANLDEGQIFSYFLRRHINRVAEKCQEDARKFRITSVPAVTSDWDDLNAVYRRTVYHDALSIVHPSRFYYSVSVCQCCYEIYLYLDELREEVILNNPNPSSVLLSLSPTNNSNSSRRPRSANDVSQSQRKLRLVRHIERSRSDLQNEDTGVGEMTSPQSLAIRQQKKVSINTDAIPVHLSDEHTQEVLEVVEEEVHVRRPLRPRPASAHAVMTSSSHSLGHSKVEEEGVRKMSSASSAPSLVIRADGDRLELVMTSEPKEDSNTPSTPPQSKATSVAETSRVTSEAIAAIMQRMSPDFSFSSLPFFSAAPFLPIATDDPPAQPLTSSSSKKKNRLYRALSRSRSKESEEEVQGRGRGGASFASLALTSPEEEGDCEDKEGVRRINWDDIITRYDDKTDVTVSHTANTSAPVTYNKNKHTSVMLVEIPSPLQMEGEQGGALSSSISFGHSILSSCMDFSSKNISKSFPPSTLYESQYCLFVPLRNLFNSLLCCAILWQSGKVVQLMCSSPVLLHLIF